MVRNHIVKFLVDERQFQRLRTNAKLKGHKTISSYLRDLALSRNLRYEQMLIEIHSRVVKNELKPEIPQWIRTISEKMTEIVTLEATKSKDDTLPSEQLLKTNHLQFPCVGDYTCE